MDADEATSRNREAETNAAKEVEFFAASVNAWYGTSLEHDKSIFALSAGGIGLLITLLTTTGVSSRLALGFYVAAIACFLLCLAAMLLIFRGNRSHIEDVLLNGMSEPDPKLARLDNGAMVLFWVGVLFAAVVGVMAAYNSYESKGKDMANEKQGQPSITHGIVQESVNGCGTFTKSFSGVGKINPSAAGNTPAEKPVAPSQPVTVTSKSGK